MRAGKPAQMNGTAHQHCCNPNHPSPTGGADGAPTSQARQDSFDSIAFPIMSNLTKQFRGELWLNKKLIVRNVRGEYWVKEDATPARWGGSIQITDEQFTPDKIRGQKLTLKLDDGTSAFILIPSGSFGASSYSFRGTGAPPHDTAT